MEIDERSVRCGRGHAYDVAREGYVNLLVGKPRGDAGEMLTARRRFLEKGGYEPLSDLVNEEVGKYRAEAGRAPALLDCGCGEGYYLRRLAALEAAGTKPLLGLDLSREAVRLAARYSNGRAAFVVADTTRRLPFLDGAFDVLLDVFAPRNPAEFARVLAPGGLLVVVTPEPDHLAELRSSLGLLKIEDQKAERVEAAFTDGFTPAGSNILRYLMHLDDDDLADIETMTPGHGRRSPLPRRADAPPLQATAAFRLTKFRRTAEPAGG